jgi:hypothetical protein
MKIEIFKNKSQQLINFIFVLEYNFSILTNQFHWLVKSRKHQQIKQLS